MKDRREKYMKLALDLAAKAKGSTYPNPMVGAVIVSHDKVRGKGYHKKCGSAHAEINAVKNIRGTCSGAEMFVTLEPCDHFGRTAPCTDEIIKRGITTVHIAMKDPNPLNRGRGIRKLRNAGLSVNVGLCAEEARWLNRKYIKFINEGIPYITVKLAQSIDGKIAARNGTSKWISSAASRNFVKKMRHDFDAIMVGINTVLKDDPFLLDAGRQGYDTARIIVDSRLRIPETSNIIKTAGRSPVILGVTELAPRSRINRFNATEGVEVIVTSSKRGRVPLRSLLKKLAKKGFVNILAEGGGEIAGSLFDEDLADEVMFFIAPKILGGDLVSIKGKGVKDIKDTIKLNDMDVQRYGDDILISGTVTKRKR